jgi:pentapeptide MXKDX repeat protein
MCWATFWVSLEDIERFFSMSGHPGSEIHLRKTLYKTKQVYATSICRQKMSLDKMSLDKMSLDKMSLDKMSLDKMSLDKMCFRQSV